MFYNKVVPPIISFSLGSVGYLWCFDSRNIIKVLEQVLFNESKISNIPIENKLVNHSEKNPYIQHRDRLEVIFSIESERDMFEVESNVFEKGTKTFEKGSSFNALNEITIEAGSCCDKFTIELYINDHFLAEVTTWGLIISTSTGSTAYSMSAGGSIIQTGVKAIWMSAINPSTLSFRPLILPLDCKITVKIPKGVNENIFRGWIDGDFKFQWMDGDKLEIQGSNDPVPFITTDPDDPIASWIKRLSSTILKY